MKNLLIVMTLFFVIASCASLNDSKQRELSESEKMERERELKVAYGSIASDLCECVNETTKDLSNETIDAFIAADKNGKNIMKVIEQHFVDNPSLAFPDGTIMERAGNEMQKTCLIELEEKFETVDSNYEGEGEQMLLKALENSYGCEFTHAIMTLGLQTK